MARKPPPDASASASHDTALPLRTGEKSETFAAFRACPRLLAIASSVRPSPTPSGLIVAARKMTVTSVLQHQDRDRGGLHEEGRGRP